LRTNGPLRLKKKKGNSNAWFDISTRSKDKMKSLHQLIQRMFTRGQKQAMSKHADFCVRARNE
jgi:hypothetical protein